MPKRAVLMILDDVHSVTLLFYERLACLHSHKTVSACVSYERFIAVFFWKCCAHRPTRVVSTGRVSSAGDLTTTS